LSSITTTAEATTTNPLAEQVVQAVAIAALFAVPAIFCVYAACVRDPDVWWHLRTGEWIMQHHAIPRVDTYSSVTAGQPWAAYSWLFELLIFKLFSSLGLVGIVAYTAGMMLAITVALHRLIKRTQKDFTVAVFLVSVTTFTLLPLYTPRPWLFTLLFFIVQLEIILHAHKSGSLRSLALLPLIYILWVNIHIQFIDGLLVLGLVCAESIISARLKKSWTQISPRAAIGTFAACVLATFVNPYGIYIYRIAHDLATQPGVLDKIAELKAMSFRSPTDYVLLALVMAAVAALARKRQLLPFETALLIIATFLSFRSLRDMWIVAISAAAILAAEISITRKASNQSTAPPLTFGTPLSIALAICAVMLSFHFMRITNPELRTRLADQMPVDAIDAIKRGNYPGPVFNTFDLGGLLIWRLRQPVSIDGRASLYGDQRIDRSINTWGAGQDWHNDPALASARVILAPRDQSLTTVLRADPRYQSVYEDKLAVVFIPRNR
jgi:hypothetical protein